MIETMDLTVADEEEGGATRHSRRTVKPPERLKEAFTNLKLYCICRKPYRQGVFMIGCDNCDEWYHGRCVGFEEDVSIDHTFDYRVMRALVIVL
jgi:hypothetical protein